jgi:RNA polymerase sigma-70 factor (ECF subfamily)
MDTLLHESLSPDAARVDRPRTRVADPDAALDIDQVFTKAYEDHRADLLRYLRVRTRDEAAAEDLCQEAYVRLFTELRAGRTPRDPAAWLRRVGRNLMVSEARRAQVARRHATRPLEAGAPDPTASGVLERETIGSMGTALQRMPQPQRHLLVLAANGLTPAEIGALLDDATAGAIRTRMHRARRLLLCEMSAVNAHV